MAVPLSPSVLGTCVAGEGDSVHDAFPPELLRVPALQSPRRGPDHAQENAARRVKISPTMQQCSKLSVAYRMRPLPCETNHPGR